MKEAWTFPIYPLNVGVKHFPALKYGMSAHHECEAASKRFMRPIMMCVDAKGGRWRRRQGCLKAFPPVLLFLIVRLVHLSEVHPPAEDATNTSESFAELRSFLRSESKGQVHHNARASG